MAIQYSEYTHQQAKEFYFCTNKLDATTGTFTYVNFANLSATYAHQ
jgi:hypothetical protein